MRPAGRFAAAYEFSQPSPSVFEPSGPQLTAGHETIDHPRQANFTRCRSTSRSLLVLRSLSSARDQLAHEFENGRGTATPSQKHPHRTWTGRTNCGISGTGMLKK